MNHDDDPLDRWLAQMRRESPTGAQTRRWKAALRYRPKSRPRFPRQLAAGLAIGFVLGLGAFKLSQGDVDREPAGNFDPTATVESVYDKSR